MWYSPRWPASGKEHVTLASTLVAALFLQFVLPALSLCGLNQVTYTPSHSDFLIPSTSPLNSKLICDHNLGSTGVGFTLVGRLPSKWEIFKLGGLCQEAVSAPGMNAGWQFCTCLLGEQIFRWSQLLSVGNTGQLRGLHTETRSGRPLTASLLPLFCPKLPSDNTTVSSACFFCVMLMSTDHWISSSLEAVWLYGVGVFCTV